MEPGSGKDGTDNKVNREDEDGRNMTKKKGDKRGDYRGGQNVTM